MEFKLHIPSDADKQTYTVYLDGQRLDGFYEPVLNDTTLQEYTLSVDVGNTPAVHTVEIVRRAEAAFGTSELLSVTLNGELEKVEDNELLVEFVGDSITCGTGNLGTSDSARENDGSSTYAFYTAKKLGN